MKIIITEEQFKNLIIKEYISDMDTFWAWISPENQFIKVPKLNHKGFIMSKYRDAGDWTWDYDRVFDKALLDGWVRVIYEYNTNNYKGELSINGHYKERVIDVIKTVFKDLLKYGCKTVYIDAEEPKTSYVFSTCNSAGKLKLMNFLNATISPLTEGKTKNNQIKPISIITKDNVLPPPPALNQKILY